jgi:putative ABC transport system permease protein
VFDGDVWRVALADLLYRRRRFAMAVLATSIAFALSLLMQGVVAQLQSETDRIVALFGADAYVVAEGGTGPFTTTKLLPAAAADALRGSPGVTRADPMVQARETLQGLDVNVLGLSPGGLGWPEPVTGRAVEQRGEAVVDRSLGYEVGERVGLGGLGLTVVGLSRDTTYYFGMPAVFLTIDDVQDAFLDGGALATAVAVAGTVPDPPPGTSVFVEDQVVDDLNRPQAGALETVNVVNGLLWLMAAGVVATMVYLSVLEGTRDIAVAKAVGATSSHLFLGVAAQGLALSLAACAVGGVLAVALAPVFPFPVEITAGMYAVVLGVGVVVGLASALVGLRRAVTVDPALAFGR